MIETKKLHNKLLAELKENHPGEIHTSEEMLQKHASNLFYISHYYPDAVYYAESEKDVLEITNFCIKHKIPLVPYGSGTSVEGHTSAVNGGICLNLSRMKKILEFNPVDSYVHVQAGMPYNELNDYLLPHGFYFPVEAGWGASVGGMTSTNASGAGATDAGSMAKNVLMCGIVVYEDNKALKINTGTRSLKSSAGYNLTNLFIGSEGTLGIITDVYLKIRREPSHCMTICCQFNDLKSAINFAIEMKGKVQFKKIELLDQLQTEACVSYSNINYLSPKMDTIIMEISGNAVSVDEEKRLILAALNEMSAEHVKVFNDKKSANAIWMMRKYACPAALHMYGKQKKVMATDACVPLSKLADCIMECYKHMVKIGLRAPLISHVGDGNFHFSLIIDANNTQEFDKAIQFNNHVVKEALKVGGTCTGEHGVGLGKMSFLKLEHNSSYFLMQKIKEAFDPLGIFNPGKILSSCKAIS